jgi:hypothetical protein
VIRLKNNINECGFPSSLMAVMAVIAIGGAILSKLGMTEFNFDNYKYKDLKSNWKEMLEAYLAEAVENYKRPYTKRNEKYWKLGEYNEDYY